MCHPLQSILTTSLSDLSRSRCIKFIDAGKDPATNEYLPLKIEPLPLGKISSLYYLGHNTVHEFFLKLRESESEGLSFVEIMRMICDCPEYAELPVRHNEDKLNEEF